MNESKKIKCLFLLTELSGYIIACLNKLAEIHPVEMHVFKWPVNAVAPFVFSLNNSNIKYYERKDYTNEQLIAVTDEINPDIILCSGWMDKGYNAVCKNFRNKIPVVLGLDNPWRGTFKQHIATLIGPVFLPQHFSHCWVPGITQKKYAVKLGFKENKIKQGAYSCDFDAFHNLYVENKSQKENVFPKKIIFVGRYTELKGTKELWDAFVEFQNENPSDWELWCLGKGEKEVDFPKHEKVKNFGFVQPAEIKKFIADCGVFILPSHYEHWGVVVHEFAAAGFPLICTTSTGAAEAFLKEGVNGYFIPPQNTEALKKVFVKISKLSKEELLNMGNKSAEYAKQITPLTWSNTFMDFLNN